MWINIQNNLIRPTKMMEKPECSKRPTMPKVTSKAAVRSFPICLWKARRAMRIAGPVKGDEKANRAMKIAMFIASVMRPVNGDDC